MSHSSTGFNMFLNTTLHKILAEKDIRKSHNSQLKLACETALEELNKDGNIKKLVLESKGATQPVPTAHEGIINAERFYLPLELAAQSHSPRIICAALDGLQKLISYGYLSGGTLDDTQSNHRLIDRVVKTFYSCFSGPQTDEAVQLQVIKGMLAIVTSQYVEVHDSSLLQAVRSCYNIHLGSRSLVNQQTAKASLTQMLNTIFARMEQEEVRADAEKCSSVLVNGAVPPEDSFLGEDDEEVIIRQLLDDLVERVDRTYSAQTPRWRQVNNQNQSPSGPALDEVAFVHVRQKDAFLVFRSLCKLSMKQLSAEPPDPKSHELRSKILSLEMLRLILQNAGPVFRSSPMFITAIKQYLCVALSKNGVSPVSLVFEISLSIFVELLAHFKQHLKMQVEVFFKEIFLYILETPSSAFQHKFLVIEALRRICENAQCVVDLYLNYDCDLSMANVFERLVNDLAKIAHGRQAIELGATPQQELRLRIRGYQCLVSVLRAMADWSKELIVNQHMLSNLGQDNHVHAQHAESAVAVGGDADSGRGSSTPVSSHASLTSLTNGATLAAGAGGTAAGGSVSAGELLDSPAAFETLKQQKELWENGINIFNKNPDKGIVFLQERGMLNTGADDVAQFLHGDERLDKTAIGDYLGQNETFHKEVMYAYIDELDFTGKGLVEAIRLFLEGFRLPGEAQKIDRLMEKFASRYYSCCQDDNVFASADAAYVLAFSIIMLTTDLHSSQVKRKMTKEQYIKMNRGINDSKDLPQEYLSAIYDEIAGNEIRMKEFYKPSKQSLFP